MNVALPIIVINLDRASDRLVAVLEQFERAKLSESVKRFAAVDATSPDFSASGYAPGTWKDRWALMPSEQACFISHREVWKCVANGTAAGAVICEDDILVSQKAAVVLQALDIGRYGVIKLDGFTAYRRYGAEIKMGGFTVREIASAVPSAGCYAISKAAARRLIEDSVEFCITLDDFLFAPRDGLRPVQLFPAVAVQGVCCMDDQLVPETMKISERAIDDMTQPGLETGPFFYRLYKRFQRAGLKVTRALVTDRRLVRRGGGRFRPDLANDLPEYKD